MASSSPSWGSSANPASPSRPWVLRNGLISSRSWVQSGPDHRTKLPFRARKQPPARLRVLCIRETKATTITGTLWEKTILQSETPVLVEFYTSWCGPCQMVHRVIDEVATDYVGRLKCYVLDADTDPQIAETYDIKAVPVVLLFKNGEKRESIVGTMPKEFYAAAIDRILAS